jgi:RecA/RadA recombinase
MATKKQQPIKVAGKAAKVSLPPIPAAATTQTPTVLLAPSDAVHIPRVTELSHEEKLQRLAVLRSKNPGAFVSIDELTTPYMLRRPTGIIELDIALGGGFPAGGPSVIGGPYNGGKSWMLWRMFAMQQRLLGNDFIGAVANTEGPFDFVYMRNCGFIIPVPDSVLNAWNQTYYERGYPQLTSQQIDFWKMGVGTVNVLLGEGEAPTGEDILDAVLAAAKSNAYGLIGLDSISGLQPRANADKDMSEEDKRAAHASMMKRFWLKYIPDTRKGYNLTTLMMIQQVVARDMSKIPTYLQQYYKEWESKGGESTKHFKLVDLTLWGTDKIKQGKDGPTVGKNVKWLTQKGKAGTHDNITGEYSYYYDRYGTDVAGDLIVSAYQRGIVLNFGSYLGVVRAGSQGQCMADETKYKSDRELRERIESDVNFEFLLRRELLASAGIQCLYR